MCPELSELDVITYKLEAGMTDFNIEVLWLCELDQVSVIYELT